MGNSHGIPAVSNDEWAVIALPKTCRSHFCGSLRIPPDHVANARLVDDGPSRATDGDDSGPCAGLVPRREYDTRIHRFNTEIGGGRRRTLRAFWAGLAVATVAPQALRLVGKDLEVWMYLAATYGPLLPLLAYVGQRGRAERRRVRALFEPWRARFGVVEVEWSAGTKHAAPRLGFKLPARPPPTSNDGGMETIPLRPAGSDDLRSQLTKLPTRTPSTANEGCMETIPLGPVGNDDLRSQLAAAT